MEIRHFIISCIAHIFLGFFLMIFSARRYSLKKTGSILLGTVILLIAVEIAALPWDSNKGFFFLMAGLRILAAQGVALYLSEYRDSRGIFTGVLSSMCLLAGMVIPEYLGAAVGYPVWIPFLGIPIHLSILLLLWHFFVPVYRENQRASKSGWGKSCVATAGFYFAAWGIGVVMYGTSRAAEAFWAVVFVILTVYSLYVIMFWMVWRLHKERQAMKSGELLERGIRALKYELQELHETENRIAVHVHDRRHLIRLMQQLMADGDYEQVKQVLNQMKQMTELTAGNRRCANPAINGIMASYEAEAKDLGIRTDLRIEFSDELKLDDWDAAAITGGLMANAIRMCRELENQEKRWMNVRLWGRKNMLGIEVSCSCRNDIRLHPETGLPVTKRGVDYGSGLQSAAYYAERNRADFQCRRENETFLARIVL